MNPFALLNKRTVRAKLNPVDVSTVFSIYPKDIHETKVTLMPSEYFIPAGSFENPSRLLVTSASWWKEIDENQPLLEIANNSQLIAESICKDHNNSRLGFNPDAHPGLFFIEGDISVDDLKKKYNRVLLNAKAKQDNWYKDLVNLADSLWAASNGNPISIAEEMRIGARELGYTGRDWMKAFVMVANIVCDACGEPRNPRYPVCPHCHAVVDQALAEKMGITFAKK